MPSLNYASSAPSADKVPVFSNRGSRAVVLVSFADGLDLDAADDVAGEGVDQEGAGVSSGMPRARR